MTPGLFVCEGSSDVGLVHLIEGEFARLGVELRLTTPALERATGPRTIQARVRAALGSIGGAPQVIVVHRDADNVDYEARCDEIHSHVQPVAGGAIVVPIIPIRMTEAWLLLSDADIRWVAGNPGGTRPLSLPTLHEAERMADPKARLREALLAAAEVTGRRHLQHRKRFPQHRRQLLERLRASMLEDLQGWQLFRARAQEAVVALDGSG